MVLFRYKMEKRNKDKVRVGEQKIKKLLRKERKIDSHIHQPAEFVFTKELAVLQRVSRNNMNLVHFPRFQGSTICASHHRTIRFLDMLI